MLRLKGKISAQEPLYAIVSPDMMVQSRSKHAVTEPIEPTESLTFTTTKEEQKEEKEFKEEKDEKEKKEEPPKKKISRKTKQEALVRNIDSSDKEKKTSSLISGSLNLSSSETSKHEDKKWNEISTVLSKVNQLSERQYQNLIDPITKKITTKKGAIEEVEIAGTATQVLKELTNQFISVRNLEGEAGMEKSSMERMSQAYQVQELQKDKAEIDKTFKSIIGQKDLTFIESQLGRIEEIISKSFNQYLITKHMQTLWDKLLHHEISNPKSNLHAKQILIDHWNRMIVMYQHRTSVDMQNWNQLANVQSMAKARLSKWKQEEASHQQIMKDIVNLSVIGKEMTGSDRINLHSKMQMSFLVYILSTAAKLNLQKPDKVIDNELSVEAQITQVQRQFNFSREQAVEYVLAKSRTKLSKALSRLEKSKEEGDVEMKFNARVEAEEELAGIDLLNDLKQIENLRNQFKNEIENDILNSLNKDKGLDRASAIEHVQESLEQKLIYAKRQYNSMLEKNVTEKALKAVRDDIYLTNLKLFTVSRMGHEEEAIHRERLKQVFDEKDIIEFIVNRENYDKLSQSVSKDVEDELNEEGRQKLSKQLVKNYNLAQEYIKILEDDDTLFWRKISEKEEKEEKHMIEQLTIPKKYFEDKKKIEEIRFQLAKGVNLNEDDMKWLEKQAELQQFAAKTKYDKNTVSMLKKMAEITNYLETRGKSSRVKSSRAFEMKRLFSELMYRYLIESKPEQINENLQTIVEGQDYLRTLGTTKKSALSALFNLASGSMVDPLQGPIARQEQKKKLDVDIQTKKQGLENYLELKNTMGTAIEELIYREDEQLVKEMKIISQEYIRDSKESSKEEKKQAIEIIKELETETREYEKNFHKMTNEIFSDVLENINEIEHERWLNLERTTHPKEKRMYDRPLDDDIKLTTEIPGPFERHLKSEQNATFYPKTQKTIWIMDEISRLRGVVEHIKPIVDGVLFQSIPDEKWILKDVPPPDENYQRDLYKLINSFHLNYAKDNIILPSFVVDAPKRDPMEVEEKVKFKDDDLKDADMINPSYGLVVYEYEKGAKIPFRTFYKNAHEESVDTWFKRKYGIEKYRELKLSLVLNKGFYTNHKIEVIAVPTKFAVENSEFREFTYMTKGYPFKLTNLNKPIRNLPRKNWGMDIRTNIRPVKRLRQSEEKHISEKNVQKLAMLPKPGDEHLSITGNDIDERFMDVTESLGFWTGTYQVNDTIHLQQTKIMSDRKLPENVKFVFISPKHESYIEFKAGDRFLNIEKTLYQQFHMSAQAIGRFLNTLASGKIDAYYAINDYGRYIYAVILNTKKIE